jgi:hypothetical protein
MEGAGVLIYDLSTLVIFGGADGVREREKWVFLICRYLEALPPETNIPGNRAHAC